MKVVILAGGFGTRLSEETGIKPKPMVEVGGMPLIWHVMNIYEAHGFREFVVALGYKGEIIKEFFLDYHNKQSDLTISLRNGEVSAERGCFRDWTVHLINTGADSLTGGRVLRLKEKLGNEPFMLTYGDGVSDVDIGKLVEFHKSHGKIATVTAVQPTARFGGMKFDGSRVSEFKEKPHSGEGWINGGFFIFEPEIFDYLQDGDRTVLEQSPLENLAKDGQLMAFHHDGFWQCMDTLRDKQLLESIWDSSGSKWNTKGKK